MSERDQCMFRDLGVWRESFYLIQKLAPWLFLHFVLWILTILAPFLRAYYC